MHHSSLRISCLLLLATAAGLAGCSTAAEDSAGGTPLPPFPSGWERNGYVIRCDLAGSDDPTTGGPVPPAGWTCVPWESFPVASSDCPDGFDEMLPVSQDIYIQAICAKTFGGQPADYWPSHTDSWRDRLDDYPELGFENERYCDTNRHFTEAPESPEADDLDELISGKYNACSVDSYCAMLDAVMTEFPSVGDISDPFRCNLAPDGDPLEPRPFRCVGSTDQACGVFDPVDAGPYDLCPVVGKLEVGEPDPCVVAVTEADASAKCAELCEWSHNHYVSNYSAAEYPMTDWMDCSVFGPLTMTWVSDPVTECYNEGETNPFDAEALEFEAELTIDGGATASSGPAGTFGLIDYRLENCVGGNCDIVIDSLMLTHALYEGTYMDVAGPAPFSVDGVEVILVGPVRGTATASPAGGSIVAFPSHLPVYVSAGEVVLDSVSLGPVDRFVTAIEDISGTYVSGILTLDIGYETVDSSISITMSTY